MHESPLNMTRSPEGGLLVRMLNSSGGTLLKGKTVRADAGTNDGMILAATSDEMAIGVVYQDILAGVYGWIVVAGIAEVLIDTAGALTPGFWVGCSTSTTGECSAQAASPGSTVQHFREIGHTIQSRAGGATTRVRCIIHFN